ncbi:hypothetical protein D3C72_657150 [compost metagenome]
MSGPTRPASAPTTAASRVKMIHATGCPHSTTVAAAAIAAASVPGPGPKASATTSTGTAPNRKCTFGITGSARKLRPNPSAPARRASSQGFSERGGKGPLRPGCA